MGGEIDDVVEAVDDIVPRVGRIDNPNNVYLSVNESNAAEALAALGYDVKVIERDLGVLGEKRPDFEISGFGRVDEYTPTEISQTTIARGIVDKISSGQTESVIITLPSEVSNFDIYNIAVRVYQNPSVSTTIDTLFFYQNGNLVQFDRSVIDNLLGVR